MNWQDRDLLDFAAKAAGMRIQWDEFSDGFIRLNDAGTDIDSWNPLTDDGDALRLAVKLEIDITHALGTRTVSADGTAGYVAEGNDPYAATRRAIVRAAAEIAKGME